jgi:hypothetical protein
MEVLVAYRNDMSICGRAMLSARSRAEVAGSLPVDASELRAKAARYRRLAEVLFDPRVIAEVHACARELEAEAAWIDTQATYRVELVKRRRSAGN